MRENEKKLTEYRIGIAARDVKVVYYFVFSTTTSSTCRFSTLLSQRLFPPSTLTPLSWRRTTTL